MMTSAITGLGTAALKTKWGEVGDWLKPKTNSDG